MSSPAPLVAAAGPPPSPAKSGATRAYLKLGRWKVPVPRRKPLRIGLGVLLLLRGLIPTPGSPVLLAAAVALLSMDLPWLRRRRRRLAVALGRRRISKSRHRLMRRPHEEAQ